MFKCIPIFKGCNRQVEYVDKRHCSLSTVPEDIIRYARSLEELLLDANHLRDLPNNFFRLNRLRKLGLSDNEIQRLSPEIQNFESLVELDVSRNDISDIPENIKGLQSLQVADFSSNPITELPAGFVLLKALSVLSLNDMSLSILPEDFGLLDNLTSLELRENLIKDLPESLAKLKKLERLDLGDNEIDHLPPHIGELCSLEELWLDHNGLMQLPDEIAKLSKLACLDVSENKLELLPDNIKGLANLTDLHLSQNLVETLPDTIGGLVKLTILKADQNRLVEITPALGHCISLQELVITENFLTELPTSIGNLTKLTNLNLDRNRLEYLPTEIGNLVNLGVLSLRENRVVHLPSDIGNCRELHVLDVCGNRLHHLPFSLTSLNLKALWLSENQAKPMLAFQTDYDEETGDQVLTCFLLPQLEGEEGRESPGGGRLIRGQFDAEDLYRKDARESWWNKDEAWDPAQVENRKSMIQFSGVDNEDMDERETNFVRQKTPHPKELKAKAIKLFGSPAKTPTSTTAGEVVGVAEPDVIHGNGDVKGEDMMEDEGIHQDEEDEVAYKERIRNELNRGMVDKRTSAELTQAVPQTEILDIAAAKGRAELARQGSLADRQLPASLAARRQNSNPSDPGAGSGASACVSRDSEEDVDDEVDKDKVADIIAQALQKKGGDEMAPSNVSPVAPAFMPAALEPQHGLPPLELGLPLTTPTSRPVSEHVPVPPKPVLHSEPDGPRVVMDVIRHEISFSRADKGLGLSIAGGLGSTPYKGEDEGVFISRVTPGGPADIAGLRVNDKVLSVNSISCISVDHYEAVGILKAAGSNITMVITREVTKLIPPPSASSVLPPSSHPVLPLNTSSLPPVQTTSMSSLSPSTPLTTPLATSETRSPITPLTENRDTASLNLSRDSEDLVVRVEKIFTTLLRDNSGLGFSIAGGLGATPYREGSESLYISKISDGGTAAKDGKLRLGDKIVQINGVDVTDARHDQAVQMLTGLERFVRLVVERETLVPRSTAPHSISGSSQDRSPKVFGVPKPYSGLYSASSYMANRPNYGLRSREPGNYSLTSDKNSRLPGLSNGESSTAIARRSSSTLPSSGSELSSQQFDSMIPEGIRSKLNQSTNGLDAVLPQPGLVTESITKTTFTETTVQRVTNTKIIEDVRLSRGGGPLGLSIIGGSDHSCVPFGTGEQGIYISKIIPGGAAADTGRLRMGDRILKVNNVDVGCCTHQEAVLALLQQCEVMILKIQHDPLPPGFEEIDISKDAGEKLGMVIKGGIKGQPGNPLDSADEGVFCVRINPGGAAAKDPRIKVGLRIIEVNGQSLLGATHQEAVNILRNAGDSIKLHVCHGFDPENLAEDGESSQESAPVLNGNAQDVAYTQNHNEAKAHYQNTGTSVV